MEDADSRRQADVSEEGSKRHMDVSETEAVRRVGLCARCAHAIQQQSAKGGGFWRCDAANRDATLLRYPPLPVRECPAHQPGTPRSGGTGA